MHSSQQEAAVREGTAGEVLSGPGRVRQGLLLTSVIGGSTAFGSTAAVEAVMEAGSNSPGEAMPDIIYTPQQAVRHAHSQRLAEH